METTLSYDEMVRRRRQEARERREARRSALGLPPRRPRAPSGCTRFTKRCEAATDMTRATPECCRRHNAQILRDVARLLDEVGARWWIDYGTLLGYCVNGGLYWNDKDTDLGILAEDRDAVLALMPKLRGLGYAVTYSRPREGRFAGGGRMKVRLSHSNRANCDLFFWDRRPDGLLDRKNYIGVDRYKGREFPAEWVCPVVRGSWEGVDVAVPAEAEKLVVHRYGENWRNLPAARTDGVER